MVKCACLRFLIKSVDLGHISWHPQPVHAEVDDGNKLGAPLCPSLVFSAHLSCFTGDWTPKIFLQMQMRHESQGTEVYSPNFSLVKLVKLSMCWSAACMSNLQITAVLAGHCSWKPLIQPPAWSRTNASPWSGQTWLEIPDLVDFIPALHTVLFLPIFVTQSVFLLFCLQEPPAAIMHHCAQRCTDTKWMWFAWKRPTKQETIVIVQLETHGGADVP